MGYLGKTMMRWVSFFLLMTLCCQAEEPAVQQKREEWKARMLSILPSIEGWCSKEKASSMFDLILEVEPKVCVEVGVFAGSSLFPTAYALKCLGSGMVYAVDPWNKLEAIKFIDPVEYKTDYEWWGTVNLDLIYISYLNIIKRYKLSDYVITIRATSEEAAREIEEIDILHLDGNFGESRSTADAGLYLPKVRSGGHIWYGDTIFPQKQEGLDILLKECDVIKIIDGGNCLLLKKR